MIDKKRLKYWEWLKPRKNRSHREGMVCLVDGQKIVKIPLARGNFAIVDADDYFRIKGFNWSFDTGYVVAGSSIDGKNIRVRMHRFIIYALKGEIVDHINGNSLDNRKQNLRFCSARKNSFNRKKVRGKSKYKGVYLHYLGKWQTEIGVNGRRLHVGLFEKQEDAARAYDEAAKKYFGEYARLNLPSKELT